MKGWNRRFVILTIYFCFACLSHALALHLCHSFLPLFRTVEGCQMQEQVVFSKGFLMYSFHVAVDCFLVQQMHCYVSCFPPIRTFQHGQIWGAAEVQVRSAVCMDSIRRWQLEDFKAGTLTRKSGQIKTIFASSVSLVKSIVIHDEEGRQHCCARLQ